MHLIGKRRCFPQDQVVTDVDAQGKDAADGDTSNARCSVLEIV
jgi:hypothetical protein